MVSYYATREWKDIKDSVLRRDGYKCQRCGSGYKLVVHHKVPRKEGGADHESNLKTVCKGCHILEHQDYSRSKLPRMGKYAPTDDELREMGLGW